MTTAMGQLSGCDVGGSKISSNPGECHKAVYSRDNGMNSGVCYLSTQDLRVFTALCVWWLVVHVSGGSENQRTQDNGRGREYVIRINTHPLSCLNCTR